MEFQQTFNGVDISITSEKIKSRTRKLGKIRHIHLKIPSGFTKSGKQTYYRTSFWGGKDQTKVFDFLVTKLGEECVKYKKHQLKLEVVQDIIAFHNPEMSNEQI